MPEHVVDFLVLNPRFPASVRHGIGRVEGCLHRIAGHAEDSPGSEPERLAGHLRADLTYMKAAEILQTGLHPFLDSVQIRCNQIGDAIRAAYLSY